jgi:hypothetical protein
LAEGLFEIDCLLVSHASSSFRQVSRGDQANVLPFLLSSSSLPSALNSNYLQLGRPPTSLSVMYPSNGLSGRNTTGYPAGSDDLTQPINLGNVRGLSSRNMYSNIVPSRPAPGPPTSSSSGLGRRGSAAGSTFGGSSRDPLGRRSSLVSPQPLAYSGLSATRPSMFESEFGSNPLPPLLPLPSGRRSGARSTELSNPRLGSGQLGSGMGLSGGLNDGNNSPSMYSRSEPIDIGPTHIGLNDWRSRISPGPPLENPTLRETRREARHRTRQDWEIDGELR